jgi:hypothetical protein
MTKALSRGIEPIRYVGMLIGKLQPAAGTLCHRSPHGSCFGGDMNTLNISSLNIKRT